MEERKLRQKRERIDRRDEAEREKNQTVADRSGVKVARVKPQVVGPPMLRSPMMRQMEEEMEQESREEEKKEKEMDKENRGPEGEAA